MVLFWQRLVADKERFPAASIRCEGVEVVYDLDALDLAEEPINESEVAADDADDGRDRGVSRCRA